MYYDRYSPVGDLSVIAICLVMIVLLFFSYVRKSRSFYIFLGIIGLVIAAAMSDVAYHAMAVSGNPEMYRGAEFLRFVYQFLLLLILHLFVPYIAEATQLPKRERRPYLIISGVILTVITVLMAIDLLPERGFYILENGTVHKGPPYYSIGYCLLVAVIIALLFRVHHRLYRQVMLSFYGSIAIAFAMLLTQELFGQNSFTVVTYLFPLLAMLYLLHSNPYDAEIGANDLRAMESTIREYGDKGREFFLMSLYMWEFDEDGKAMPREVKASIRRYATAFFRHSMLFEAGKGHEILIIRKDRDPDYEKRAQRMLGMFDGEYRRFRYDYKIVIGDSVEEITRQNGYVSLIRDIHRGMEENSTHRITSEDVKRFHENEYILKELDDIYRKQDPMDPRVLVYCQPVLNIRTHRYDTAEALMRLRLDEAGIVFPDQFIPLAEENGYIHTLTRIILYKTGMAIRSILEEGYALERISVNVSALELKDDDFCEDIRTIIRDSGAPKERIAIELTESQKESDFLLMKNKIDELKEEGIIFYLDDFGTGYSNMERIIELPFDIIKFDRSMVQAGASSQRSEKIVSGMAGMFRELDYDVLYEGVESERDEHLCEEMDACYLQGYRYSRPIPVEELRRFLTKTA